jgi:hypothetical protein
MQDWIWQVVRVIMNSCFSVRAGCLLLTLLAGGEAVAQPAAGEAPRAETAADISTRALLDALEERDMPDVSLEVISRVQADPGASQELKREVLFRQAAALIGVSRTEADRGKRNAMLDQAEAVLDEFLEKGRPTDRQAIAAYTQKGNLLVERGRAKAEQAGRPGADAAALRAAAARCFDEAIKALDGNVKPGEPIEEVTNAEDAVLVVLRQVDDEIAAVKGIDPKAARPGKGGQNDGGKDGGKDAGKEGSAPPVAPKPRRLTLADRRRLESLEAEQEALRAALIQTRLTAAAALFEKAKAYPEKSKEWTAALAASTKRFKELAEKYPTKGGGLFARYYEGRNYALQGEWEQALETLAPLTVLDQRIPLAILLRSRALNTSLECMLALEKYDQFDASARAFALEDIDRLPGGRLDADWLGLKYRTAVLLKARAEAMDPKDAASRAEQARLLADAKRLAIEVAKANAEFADPAREIAAALGREVAEGGQTFQMAMDEAAFNLGQMQAEAAKAKAARDPAAKEAARKAAGGHRNAALASLEDALRLAGIADPLGADRSADDSLEGVSIDQVNRARYLLTYLLYDAERYPASAALGRMLAEDYPNATGSRQAAKIAMAACQQAARQGTEEDRARARGQTGELAGIVLKTWPESAEAADAAVIAISGATAAADPAGIVAILDQLPSSSPRRTEVLLRGGVALWQEVQKARRAGGDGADEVRLDRWTATARETLDAGLTGVAAGGSLPAGTLGSLAVAAALSRVQIAMEDGDEARAAAVLTDPVSGPWTLFRKKNPSLQQGSLAEAALTLALRLFIQRQEFGNAQQAMDGLEKAAGTGQESSAKLSAMYLSMGRDLQDQLQSLGDGDNADDPKAQERARRILGGFETFLDRVAARDKKISSQMWVATTYSSLGSGQSAGRAVAAAKASEYLAKSARAYETLLANRDNPEVKRFEPSIRLQLAGIYRQLGDWAKAQDQIDSILGDPARQNSLETQLAAAEILQASAAAAAGKGDAEKADTLYREAVSGRKGAISIWGWSSLANKLARQGLSGSGEPAERAREIFFKARLQVAECLLARARLPGRDPQERGQRLETAKTAILMTRKLYPDLGGPTRSRDYERVLKAVQKEMGDEPSGFSEIDDGGKQASLTGPAASGGSR